MKNNLTCGSNERNDIDTNRNEDLVFTVIAVLMLLFFVHLCISIVLSSDTWYSRLIFAGISVYTAVMTVKVIHFFVRMVLCR